MKASTPFAALVRELDAEGYFRYVAEEVAARAKTTTLAGGDLYTDETRRVLFLDAETVYESGAGEFITEVSPFLSRIGAPILSFEEEIEKRSFYDVVLNGRRFRIRSMTDDDARGRWFPPTVRLLRAINAVLAQSGSLERVFFDVVGNDTMVVFLSAEQARIIAESDAAKSGQVPLLRDPSSIQLRLLQELDQ